MSYFFAEPNQSITIDFGEIAHIQHIQFMTGPSYSQVFLLEFSYDGENWGGDFFVETGRVFAWDIRYLIVQTRFVRLTPLTDSVYIMEMGFRDAENSFIRIANVDPIGEGLFDEQHLLPIQALDYMHSTYFDEVFYPKTAYQLISGMVIYEWTHPPLGRVIIAWGIEIFGMTPFGWRFMSTLAGVLMLIPLYCLALAMFKNTFWAGFATFIFAFDFMHYVQTRVGMTDSFVVLFILTMYYFMYKHIQTDFFASTYSKIFVYLFFSGIFMGLAIATKWFGLYGALGIAVIFFISMGKRYMLYRQDPAKYGDFYKRTFLTFTACIVFFVVVPAIIYILSYVPYGGVGSLYTDRSFWTAFYQNQIDMFNFHMNLEAEHDFSSYWWEWIINWRPVLYYDNTLPNGLRQGISAFGNPVVWWGGIPAILYTFYRAITTKETNASREVSIFLLVGYIAFIFPWLIVARVTFIYYYFSNTIFLVLMIAYTIKESKFFERAKIGRQTFACMFAGVTMLLFLLFYPVLTGIPISIEFVETFLRWPFMREWVLVL
ncbi:MAG: phospholipid carrier-dependent glycosyltransferase [Defluviitaleaceae bacterium]|nr:phospholipid carrier-dependent glycosyltransferase [Defluviitaleaceae bacterium]